LTNVGSGFCNVMSFPRKHRARSDAKTYLTRIFHEWPAATADMTVLPGVLGCRPLRRTVQVRLGTNPAVPRDELPGGTPIFVVSRQQFVKYPG
jgi:hypothetical protein